MCSTPMRLHRTQAMHISSAIEGLPSHCGRHIVPQMVGLRREKDGQEYEDDECRQREWIAALVCQP
eukprot:IDg19259t1